MPQYLRHFAFALIALIWFSSCNKGAENARYISKDAIAILSVNTTNIGKKVAWSALSGSKLLKEMMESTGDTTDVDVAAIGIRPLATFYAYLHPDKRFLGNSRLSIILPLDDEKAFEKFLLQKFPMAQFKKGSSVSLAVLNDQIAAGWNKHTAIITSALSNERQYGAESKADVPMTVLLEEEIEKAFAMNKSESMADNKTFTDFIAKDNDIALWIDYERLSMEMPQEMIGQTASIVASQRKLIEGSKALISMNFEKGKIAGEITYMYNDDTQNILQAFEKDAKGEDLWGLVPGHRLNLALGYHFNPNGFHVLADKMGLLPFVRVMLKEAGIDWDEILNTFTGDLLFTVADLEVQAKNTSYMYAGQSITYTAPVPTWAGSLIIKIKDTRAFQKLLEPLIAKGELVAIGEGAYKTQGELFIYIKGDKVVINNQPAYLSAGNTGALAHAAPKEFNNYPYSIFIDIKGTVASLPLDLLYGKQDTAVFAEAKQLFESFKAYGGGGSKNQSNLKVELSLQDKSENSLLQLIHFSKKVTEAEKKGNYSLDEVIPADDSGDMDEDTMEAI